MTDDRACQRCHAVPPGDAGHCNLCCEEFTPGGPMDMLRHLQNVHPEAYGDGPQTWPDGGLVFHDDTDYTVADIEERDR